MRQLTALLLSLFILAGIPASAQTRIKSNGSGAGSGASARFGNVEAINAKQMREWLTYIASDELEGRDTPSKGLDLAAKYIAAHLASLKIKPAGDEGTYFQKFPLKLSRVDPAGTRLDLNGKAFTYGTEFLANMNAANIPASQIVFAGNGWVIKSKNIDPYKGIDVKDKIVVVVNSLPKGITFGDLQGPAGGDWYSPPLYAQTHGAKAVLTFASFGTMANWDGIRWNQMEKGAVSYGGQESQIKIPTITMSPKLMAHLFDGEKLSATNLFNRTITGEPFESFALNPEKRISGAVAVKAETVYTQNVVGILEGTDPVLKNQVVAIGAHYDHVGMNPFAAGDKIFNGADDDGSGTVGVMAIAKAFAEGAQKPKRSILFIWHAGEEKGLWGSDYYTSNSTVPISSIVTQLNVDMIGRYQNPGDENHPQNKNLPKPNEIFTIGSKMMSTELGEVAEAVNKSFLNLNFNYKYDDPKDPEQFFYRSDHYNYARKGVPIIFYMDGSHTDYHQVTDSIDKINFEQMEKVTKTIFATGWELANRPTRPKVDKPLQQPAAEN